MCCGGVLLAKDEQKPPSAEQPNSKHRGGEEQGVYCIYFLTLFADPRGDCLTVSMGHDFDEVLCVRYVTFRYADRLSAHILPPISLELTS